MIKLFFWNNWHNGDIIFERPLVWRILDRYPDVQISWGCWRNHEILIRDLAVTVIAHQNDDRVPGELLPLCPPDHIPIYLWVGQYPDTKHTCWRNVVEVYNRQVVARGLPLTITCGQVPMIDFPAVDVSVRPNSIYVENGKVRAMQCRFEFDMRRICTEFPQFNFYCTADPGFQAPNLFDASSLNLVELSSLSNKCIALVGKGSGTYSCAMTEFNRFKPQAIMNFHSHDGTTFWEYPGCPARYLETYEELRQFFQELITRPHIDLASGNSPVRNPAIPNVPPATPRTYAALISNALNWNVTQQARGGQDPRILRQLVHARRQFVDRLQATPDSALPQLLASEWALAHRNLLVSDLRLWTYQAIGETEIETAEFKQVAEIEKRVAAGIARPGGAQDLLSLMLYKYPQQLPPQMTFDLTALPGWFLGPFLYYLIVPPVLFIIDGDAEAHAEFMQRWLHSLRQSAAADPTHPFWRDVIAFVAQNTSVIATYFNSANIKELFADRAWIMERFMENSGHALEHTFPPRDPSRRIRLGIIAAAYHPCAETFALLPMLEHLGDDFEVTLYCYNSYPNPIEQYCRGKVQHFTVLPNDSTQQARAIRADDLDILFFATNVAAVTNQTAILATHRLARRHVTSIFSIVTTGFPKMDYYISGTQTDPCPTAQDHYTEKLIQLDGSIHCFAYGPRRISSVKLDRATAGIPTDAVVYSSGANMYKLIPELIEAWAKILLRVPNSYLLLYPYGPNWSNAYPRGAFLDALTRRLAKHGIPMTRLKMLDSQPPPTREDIIEVLRLSDIYMDSFPFSGSTSLMEPLEIAIPCIVRYSDQLRGAMGYGMIKDMNIPELIAADEAGYIDLAVRLGLDREFRKQMSDRVRQAMNTTPSFLNARRHSDRFAAVFRDLVKRD